MILYHVTKERFVKKILRQGLRPRNIPRLEYGKTIKKYVFLTDRKGIRTIGSLGWMLWKRSKRHHFKSKGANSLVGHDKETDDHIR